MDAVGKLRHHATGKYGTGHTIVKVCLYYRGVTIPWGSWLYIKKEHCGRLEVPFRKLTELAAEAIRNASLPSKFKVTVLFDAFYLRPKADYLKRWSVEMLIKDQKQHLGLGDYRVKRYRGLWLDTCTWLIVPMPA